MAQGCSVRDVALDGRLSVLRLQSKAPLVQVMPLLDESARR